MPAPLALPRRTPLPAPRRPVRLVLAGIDGSGKSTAASRLAAGLAERGLRVRVLTAPGGRRTLDGLARRAGTTALALLGPWLLSRIESAVRAVRLLRGERALAALPQPPDVVVHDRHAVCQRALDAARGVSTPSWFLRLAGRLPEPDLVLFLEVPPVLAAQRVRRRGTDVEAEADLAAFDAGYRSLEDFADFVVVDAAGTPAETAEELLAAVDTALDRLATGPPSETERHPCP